jgi:arsenite methyltransferase
MRQYEGRTVFNPIYLFYLESKSRDDWQMPNKVMDTLRVAPGQVVADVGAGGGYFTEKLSKRVGPAGRVFATDVQTTMVKKLHRRVREAQLTNVTVVAAGFDDPSLPARSCDLVFFSSVYKEIEGREAYMKRLQPALKPEGRVAILEYRPDDPNPGPPKQYRLSEAEIVTEMQAAGYHLVESFDFLPRECLLVFRVSGGQEESALAEPRQAGRSSP